MFQFFVFCYFLPIYLELSLGSGFSPTSGLYLLIINPIKELNKIVHPNVQILSEFTHGNQEKVSKTEFKKVLSDILIGMAAGFKRDPIVILRIDGEDLLEFINGLSFEPEMISIFSEIESSDQGLSIRDSISKALEKLTVEQGMPPSSDPWVIDLLSPYY